MDFDLFWWNWNLIGNVCFRQNSILFFFGRAEVYFFGEFIFVLPLKMALHYTENKSNANASVIKTPFLIEDILDRSTAKTATTSNLITFKKHNLEYHNGDNQSFNGSRSTNGSNESALNMDKNGKHNGEISTSESEFRRNTQSDRWYVWHP